MRRVLGNLVAAFIGFAVVLGGLEVVFRVLPVMNADKHQDDGSIKHRFNPYRPDSVLGYALRPDAVAVHQTDDFLVTVHTDGLGMRGEPGDEVAPPGSYRILVVGDSFAFGFGVKQDETFSRVLARTLGRDGFRVHVWNAGVPGWSADNELLYLRQKGFALAPDLVLLATAENDPGDLLWNRITLGPDKLPVRIESTVRVIDPRGRMHYVGGTPDLRFPGSTWLAGHSRLYNALRYRIVRYSAQRTLEEEAARRERAAGPTPQGSIASLSPKEILRGLHTGIDFQIRYHRFLVDAIHREAAAHDIKVRTLLVSFRESAGTVEPLHRDCAAEGSHCLDTRTLFTAADRPKVFFPHDGHWTAEGHRRVGEAIAAWLEADPELDLGGTRGDAR